MSLQGSDISMESSKLNRSLLNRWDSAEGNIMARPEAEIRSEPQRGKHETAKIDPEENQACLWGAFCRVRSPRSVFCSRIAEDFWGPSSTTPLLGTTLTSLWNESSHHLQRFHDPASSAQVIGLEVENWPAVHQSQDLGSHAWLIGQGLGAL